MKKVLIAVDEGKSSKAVLTTYYNLTERPEAIVLLHVERLEGDSMMVDMLGEAELSTLRESLSGTEHKATLDKKAERILEYYRKELSDGNPVNIKTVIRDGHAAEEVLRVAEAEKVDMIILGYTGRRGLARLITGSITREVESRSKVPVVVAKNPVVCEEPYTWRDAYYAVSFSTLIVLVLFFIGKILEKSGAILP